MLKIIEKKKIWFSVAILLAAAAIFSLFAWNLKFGIDFTGGNLMELNFSENRPTVMEMQDKMSELNLGSLVVQPVGETGIIMRFQNSDAETHKKILEKVGSQAEELRFDSVGPTIGNELKRKTFYALFLAIIAILIYIAWAFRKVSKPVESWKYGLASVISLTFNIVVVLGVFAVLGKFAGMEINTPFVAALLTILGYTINDTIVVFDRVRENLPKSNLDFSGTVNLALNQTIVRSLNTSITTMLVLTAVLIFGGATIRDFVLAMLIGVAIGTWSSIFLASPLLLSFQSKKQ
ncbi:MAG: protein translocase subunit SecF [Patescibacteria group bacterium]|jgi:preprotein translocase subunit SecF